MGYGIANTHPSKKVCSNEGKTLYVSNPHSDVNKLIQQVSKFCLLLKND